MKESICIVIFAIAGVILSIYVTYAHKSCENVTHINYYIVNYYSENARCYCKNNVSIGLFNL